MGSGRHCHAGQTIYKNYISVSWSPDQKHLPHEQSHPFNFSCNGGDHRPLEGPSRDSSLAGESEEKVGQVFQCHVSSRWLPFESIAILNCATELSNR